MYINEHLYECSFLNTEKLTKLADASRYSDFNKYNIIYSYD